MILCFDEYQLDIERLELTREGEPIKSDALLLRMLAALVGRAGQLVTKQDLILSVWDARAVADNAVPVAMTRLRKLLGHERSKRDFIVTIHGRGYRFVRDVTRREVPASDTRRVNATPRPAGPPFVGRERATKQLRGALDEAREGRGSACMLLGEPGIGKTRAVEVIAIEAAKAGVPV